MSLSELNRVEYEVLRATIRERGTARLVAVLLGLASWAALAMALRLIDQSGAVTLVPLVVLVAAFEINFFVHTGVERIGRYLQVFYEERAGSIGWETTAMNFGAKFPGRGLDPLFSIVFFSAGVLNFFNALATTELRSAWTVVSLAAHLAFNYRIVRARRISATQRAIELDAFRTLANH
jgi:hypothetical protein